ncbi:MAG: hypothetical protein Q4E81_06170 [Succinatimonas sp.]|nr:hypothetical protein [Succinatimonas sp.]
MTAVTLNTNNNINVANLNDKSPDIGILFAQLQMSLGATNRAKAESIIKDIQAQQTEAKKYAEAINLVRSLKQRGDMGIGDVPSTAEGIQTEINKSQNVINDLKSMEGRYKDNECLSLKDENFKTVLELYNSSADTSSFIDAFRTNSYNHGKAKEHTPDNLHLKYECQGMQKAFQDRIDVLSAIQLCRDLGVDSSLLNGSFTKDKMETIISNLQTKQDTIGSGIQQQMVYVQDYIGQYNAYTSGSTTAISEANSTLKTVAQGR